MLKQSYVNMYVPDAALKRFGVLFLLESTFVPWAWYIGSRFVHWLGRNAILFLRALR